MELDINPVIALSGVEAALRVLCLLAADFHEK